MIQLENLPLPNWTGSGRTVSLVEQWIRECRSKHWACRAPPSLPSKEVYGPTRLIDLSETSGLFVARLCEDQSKPERAEYLTLSHCWGGTSNVKLTSETLEKLRAGYFVRDLPRTFRDAATLATRLGFRYLWIDSLCILQDSKSDWKQQAPQMAFVYANSACTIAGVGPSSDHGLFVSRKAMPMQPCLFSDSGDAKIYCQKYQEDRPDQDTAVLETVPLLRRGWVVQERLLSRRIVYFGGFEVAWECCAHTKTETMSASACEALLHGSGASFFRDQEVPLKRNLEAGLSDFRNSTLRCEAFLNAWHRIVDRYSAAALTFESDREIAITGIVFMIEERTSLTYSSGLFINLAVPELMWYTATSSDSVPARASIDAPTWSWLSIHGRIRHQLTMRDLFSAKGGSLYQADVRFREKALLIQSLVKRVRTHKPSGLFRCSTDEHISWRPDMMHEWSGPSVPDVPAPEHTSEIVLVLLATIQHDSDMEPICAVSDHHVDPGCGHAFTEMGLVLSSRGDHLDNFVRVGTFLNTFNNDGRGFGETMFMDDEEVEDTVVTVF